MNDKKVEIPSTATWLIQTFGLTRGAGWGIFGFSLVSNLLLLVSPIYMLQIYDRVLVSGSEDTLIWLSVIAIFLLTVYAAAEAGRRLLSTLAARRIDDRLSALAFKRLERVDQPEDALAHDLSNIRKVKSPFQHGTVLSFIDMPFVPLFLGVLMLIHPVLGVISLIGVILIFGIATLAEFVSRNGEAASVRAHARAWQLATGLSGQRSALVSMGLVERGYDHWRIVKSQADEHSGIVSRQQSGFAGASRALRQILQVLILGAGAALVLAQELSPGGIVAASIIMSRALAPIDQLSSSWTSIVQSIVAWADVRKRLSGVDLDKSWTPIPTPEALLSIDKLAVAPDQIAQTLIRPFSIELRGGVLVSLSGENGAGKTTVLQTLAGALSPRSGSVRLGGRDIHDWASADRGPHIGYLPQAIELFPGTVSDNISRFGSVAPQEMFSASNRSGAYASVLALPNGYDTLLGPNGCQLSEGQKQLIGLARALSGSPILLLLDEPTANLDSFGAARIIECLLAEARRGVLVIAATHDARLLERSNIILSINQGAMLAKSLENKDRAASVSLIQEFGR